MALAYYGDEGSFNTVCFGMPDSNTREYLLNKWDNVKNLFSNNRFIEETDRIMKTYSSNEYLNKARSVLKSTGRLLLNPNEIYLIKNLEDFQTATPTMQRWIMANPKLRKLYQRQLVYGYGNSYLDLEPWAVGDDHYDYRKVVDGIALSNYVNLNQYNLYHDINRENDRELTPDEQFDILETWRHLEYILENTNEDPTNIFGGKR